MRGPGDFPGSDLGCRRRSAPLRRKTVIPKGTIAIHTYPMHNDTLRNLGSLTYRACCKDYGPDIFIEMGLPPAERVEARIGLASANRNVAAFCSGSDPTYAPCVINQTRKRFPHHQAVLLMPPNFSERPDFFVPGLVIPEMTVVSAIGNKDDPNGYVLTSRLDPSQELFMPGHWKMGEIYRTEGLTLQGMLTKVPKNDHDGRKKTRPVVRISMDSLSRPEIMAANMVAVDSLLESDEKFWWDDLD
jgi:hypothetical protein